VKKGIAVQALAMIILTLVLSGVIGTGIYQYIKKSKSAQDVELCKLSVFAAAHSKTLGIPLTSLDCKRHTVIFEDESQAEINKELARLLQETITVTGEGQWDWAESEWVAQYADKSKCVLWATIEFKGNAKKYNGNSLFDYFNKNVLPKTKKGYWDYFKGIIDKKTFVDINTDAAGTFYQPLDTSQKYALYFMRLSDSYFQGLATQLGINPDININLLGYTITTNLDANNVMSYIRLVPVDKVDECEVFMN